MYVMSPGVVIVGTCRNRELVRLSKTVNTLLATPTVRYRSRGNTPV